MSRVTRLLEQEEMVVRDLLDCSFWLELREHAREGSPAKYAIFNSDGVLMAMVRGKEKAEAAAAEIARKGSYTVK